MKLMEIVLSQPQQELIQRIKYKGLVCNTNSRQEMTEQLVNDVLNKQQAEVAWHEMTIGEKHLLLRMCFSSSPLALSQSELRTYLKVNDRPMFQEIVQSLKNKSWLFQDRSQFFHVPQELKSWMKEFFQRELEENMIFLVPEKQIHYTVIDDLYELMDFFSSKTIRLTKNNILYKKDLTKILSSLRKEESIPKEKWRFGYGRHFDFYPDCFSLLYDFCYDQGWLMEGEELVVTEKWENDQEMGVNELLDKLQRTYVKIYRRPIPQLPFIMNVLKDCLPWGMGIERNELVRIMSDFVDPYYYDSATNIINKRVLQMLLYIHFLSVDTIDGEEFITPHPRLMDKATSKKALL